jgi:hypothetical protein
MKIITNGDSWTFGSEIVSPEHEAKYSKNYQYTTQYDYFDGNDVYRIPRTYSYYLGELFQAEEVINLSTPADDNGSILNRTILYLTENYISTNKPTDDLLVIVGWSSPERNFFWYKDEKLSFRFRIWPNVPHFTVPHNKDFWQYYISYLWNEEEYIPRYMMNNILLQGFCEYNNIKWLAFNSFYQTDTHYFHLWQNLDIREIASKLELGSYHYDKIDKNLNINRQHKTYNHYHKLWDTIDPIKFYKKNDYYNTFKNFIDQSDIEQKYFGMHPSDVSHKAWAKELYRYIKENNII